MQKNGHTSNGHVKDQQPYSLEAERAVLGSLLIDQETIIHLAPFLKPADFYLERHSWIFEAVKSLHDQRTPADLITLCDQLEKQGRLSELGGAAYLSNLINATPTSLHAEYYARIVERDAIKRRLIDTAAKIAKLAYDAGEDEPDKIIGEANKLLLEAASGRQGDKIKFAGELVQQLNDHTERVLQAPKGITGIPTGLTDLDLLLGGLQKSDMVVLAGRPGMGKTTLAMQIARKAAKSFGKRSLVFSLEMSGEQLIQRLVAAESGIDSQRIRAGQIRDDEWDSYFKAGQVIANLPIAIMDTAILTPAQMRTEAIRHHHLYNLDLIVIDYIQRMASNGKEQNRHQEVSQISRSIKSLARELNIPVLALSQLSRSVESRADKRPMLSDLYESGAIEADADVVIFMYRDDVYNPDSQLPNVAEIIVSKHRSGPTGIFSAYFKRHLTEFVDLAVRVIDFQPVE